MLYIRFVDSEEQYYRTQQSHQIALDSQDSEQKRIFHKLEYAEIKGNHHEIDVHPHEEVQKRKENAGKEHHAQKSGGSVVHVEEENVVNQKPHDGCIDNAVHKTLTKIPLDGVEEIAPQEHTLAPEHIPHDVGRSHTNGTEGKEHKSGQRQQNIIRR